MGCYEVLGKPLEQCRPVPFSMWISSLSHAHPFSPISNQARSQDQPGTRNMEKASHDDPHVVQHSHTVWHIQVPCITRSSSGKIRIFFPVYCLLYIPSRGGVLLEARTRKGVPQHVGIDIYKVTSRLLLSLSYFPDSFATGTRLVIISPSRRKTRRTQRARAHGTSLLQRKSTNDLS